MARVDGIGGNRESASTQCEGGRRGSAKAGGRPWPVTAIGLLMLLQAAGLFFLGLLHLGAAYLVELGLLDQVLERNTELLEKLPIRARALIAPMLGVVNEDVLLSVPQGGLTSLSLLFIALSALAVLGVIGFLRMWRNAWMNAMLVQGLGLLIALTLYFNGRPGYVYLLMLFSVFLVFYLNRQDVQIALRPAPRGSGWRSDPCGEGDGAEVSDAG